MHGFAVRSGNHSITLPKATYHSYFTMERNGEYWIIGCGMDDRNAVLHKFYAMNELGREPHLIRSFDYNIDSGNVSECGLHANISMILQQISEDGARWEELLKTPPAQTPGNPEHCRFCEFEHYCSKHYPETTQTSI